MKFIVFALALSFGAYSQEVEVPSVEVGDMYNILTSEAKIGVSLSSIRNNFDFTDDDMNVSYEYSDDGSDSVSKVLEIYGELAIPSPNKINGLEVHNLNIDTVKIEGDGCSIELSGYKRSSDQMLDLSLDIDVSKMELETSESEGQVVLTEDSRKKVEYCVMMAFIDSPQTFGGKVNLEGRAYLLKEAPTFNGGMTYPAQGPGPTLSGGSSVMMF